MAIPIRARQVRRVMVMRAVDLIISLHPGVDRAVIWRCADGPLRQTTAAENPGRMADAKPGSAELTALIAVASRHRGPE
ncbi:hypothetical protein GCM10010411_87870 [Actinomadura fulvescens]|uniref:Uncharacterized protein n=1 Tax=Actinomadura fulvescens TaxID=46160 RepID=A0ABN3QUQ9_9ACTN